MTFETLILKNDCLLSVASHNAISILALPYRARGEYPKIVFDQSGKCVFERVKMCEDFYFMVVLKEVANSHMFPHLIGPIFHMNHILIDIH